MSAMRELLDALKDVVGYMSRHQTRSVSLLMWHGGKKYAVSVKIEERPEAE